MLTRKLLLSTLLSSGLQGGGAARLEVKRSSVSDTPVPRISTTNTEMGDQGGLSTPQSVGEKERDILSRPHISGRSV